MFRLPKYFGEFVPCTTGRCGHRPLRDCAIFNPPNNNFYVLQPTTVRTEHCSIQPTAKLQFTTLLHEVHKAKKCAIWQEQEYFQIIYKFKILLNRCQILCPDGKLFDGSKNGKKKKWNIFITENNEILQNIVSFKRNIACWIFHKKQEFFPFLPEQPGKDPIAKFKKICIM